MAPLAIRDNFGAPSPPNIGLIIGVIAGILGALFIVIVIAKVAETRNWQREHATTLTSTPYHRRPEGNRASAPAASRRSRPLENNDAFMQTMMVENNNIIMTMLNNNAAAATASASAPAEACVPAAHSHPHPPPPVVCGPPDVVSVPSVDPPPPYSMTTPGV